MCNGATVAIMRIRALLLSTGLVLGLLAALPALPASAKSISTSNLKSLSNTLNKGKHLTYYAQYTALSNGQKSTVTIAQSPPKSYFGSSNSSRHQHREDDVLLQHVGEQRQLGEFGKQRQLREFGELGRGHHHDDDREGNNDLPDVEGLQSRPRV